VRIGVSSSSFRRPLAAGDLTQLEWVERAATGLGVDGILTDISDFPRLDREYVAQLRKIAVDLGIVPFGIDAPALLDDGVQPDDMTTLSVAREFGALVVRMVLPAPGDVPPAAFAAAVARTKAACRLAKTANVTLIVPAQEGTLGPDEAAVQHLLKDVDSAWIRACPQALDERAVRSARERFPAHCADLGDDPARVVAATGNGWLILDAHAPEAPWEAFARAIDALRAAEMEERRRDRNGRLEPG
jgi:hypothetical protein